jgi:hypothetical protein
MVSPLCGPEIATADTTAVGSAGGTSVAGSLVAVTTTVTTSGVGVPQAESSKVTVNVIAKII